MAKIRLTEKQENKKRWLIEQMGDNYKPIDEELVDALAFACDQLARMDATLNAVPAMLQDKIFMSSRDKFVKQFESGLKMLDITPQARNKAKVEMAKSADPLTELLGDL